MGSELEKMSRKQRTYACGDVELDPLQRMIRVGGKPVMPTYMEFEILLRLIREPGRVFTRSQLRPAAANGKGAGPRAVDVHIARLRQKIAGARSFTIEAVQHVGYRCSDTHVCEMDPRPATVSGRTLQGST
jgi:DNA-binding response OmpR family regulator